MITSRLITQILKQHSHHPNLGQRFQWVQGSLSEIQVPIVLVRYLRSRRVFLCQLLRRCDTARCWFETRSELVSSRGFEGSRLCQILLCLEIQGCQIPSIQSHKQYQCQPTQKFSSFLHIPGTKQKRYQTNRK